MNRFDHATLLVPQNIVDSLRAIVEPIATHEKAEMARHVESLGPLFAWAQNLKARFIDQGPRFVVLAGIAETSLHPRHYLALFRVVANLFGTIIPQHTSGLDLVEVKDRGTSIASG